jgi:hypothetical protein
MDTSASQADQEIEAGPPSQPTPNPSLDDYYWDPTASPRGNHIARLVALGIFCMFCTFGLISIIAFIVRRVRAAKKLRRERQLLMHRSSRRNMAPAIASNTGLWGKVQESPDTSDSKSMSPDEKGYILATPDDEYEHDPYSPAAAAAARSRSRMKHLDEPVSSESLVSVGNFSRPGPVRVSSRNEIAKPMVCLPSLQMQDEDGKVLRSATLEALCYDEGQLYNHLPSPYDDEWPSPTMAGAKGESIV